MSRPMSRLLPARKKNLPVNAFLIFLTLLLAAALVLPALCLGGEPGKVPEGQPDKLMVGHFSQGMLDNWEQKEFNGHSQYRLIQEGHQTVLEGSAKNSASGLLKKIRVDITKTPYLNWSWRVVRAHPPLDEKSKQGDDYAARVYIVVDGGILFWKTIALNYVWSSSQPVGSTWPNAYAGKNVMLMALASGSEPSLTWHTEKRNVYDDFKKHFDKDITHIDAVAIMTDSDDSGGNVIACYGDIFFSPE